MKFITVLLILFLFSCSDAPEQKVEASKETESTENKVNSQSLLKGHKDALQKAKDMEKEVLKAAEKQKKMIDDLDE